MENTAKTVKLTNGKRAPLDADGYIRVEVQVDLSDIIDNNLEGLLDLLSDAATGSEALMDVNYGVKEALGDTTLTMWVTGDPENCVEGERVARTEDGYEFVQAYPGRPIEVYDADGNSVDEVEPDDPRFSQYEDAIDAAENKA